MPTKPRDSTFRVNYIKGYPSLAAFIASDKDKSTAIYRRFDRLSARNLLYLQSELVELEARQDELDAEDRNRTTGEKASTRDWEILKSKAREANNVNEKERMELVLEIRGKIKEYREAILLESTLISLQPPQPRILEAFRHVFHNTNAAGETFPTLGGRSASILDDGDDLVALRSPPEEDRLTGFLRNYFPVLFITRITDGPLTYISERRLRMCVAVINVLLTAILLFGAIYNLFYVRKTEKRLGIIAGYTTLFATCVGLLTNARRSEVFAACAAYAAVLVVFVSGNIGSGGTA
ncbi:hypothetical protein N7G274_008331 [Stereocaulon virgatum]|uniref:DUF6594 domain-containing protein n=1 Tax=Stereocaulon virgatum TaxID=373712 RepID=A0ABR4A215_9LECA